MAPDTSRVGQMFDLRLIQDKVNHWYISILVLWLDISSIVYNTVYGYILQMCVAELLDINSHHSIPNNCA